VSLRRITTKANRTMAVAVAEDLSGRVDLVLFPDNYDRFGGLLNEGAILDVRGKLERRGEALQIVCESISVDLPLAVESEPVPDPLVIRFAPAIDPWREIRAMQRVNEILLQHEGPHPVILEVPGERGAVVALQSRSRKIEWSEELARDLVSVPGVSAAAIRESQPQRLAS
jgi:DNA polymerase-3 subunit alpha